MPTRAEAPSISIASALSHTSSVAVLSVPSISVRPEKCSAEGVISSVTRWAAGRKVSGRRMPGGETSGAGWAVRPAPGVVATFGPGSDARSALQAARRSRTTAARGERAARLDS